MLRIINIIEMVSSSMIRAAALAAVLATSALAQYAGTYTGYVVSLDGNDSPVLNAWTVVDGGMAGSGSCGSDQYSHEYYAYAQINGPNGTYSPYPTTNSTGGGSSCPMSTRIDSYIPVQNLGTYSITQRGWAYCTFVGSTQPFTDTGDMPTNVYMNNWVQAFDLGTDFDGNVVLTQDDYNTLQSQGLIAAGVGATIAISQPELWPILTVAIVVVSAAYVTYQLAQAIKKYNYDRLALEYCRKRLVESLEIGYDQGRVMDCRACYDYCRQNSGYWPSWDCPTTP